MKHESAGSYCKEQLNILHATANTQILQSLFLHCLECQHLKTGLRRCISELQKAADNREKSDFIQLPLNSMGLWWTVSVVHVWLLKESVIFHWCCLEKQEMWLIHAEFSFTRWIDDAVCYCFLHLCVHTWRCVCQIIKSTRRWSNEVWIPSADLQVVSGQKGRRDARFAMLSKAAT